MHLPYIRSVKDVELRNQRVLIRADLNVPIKDSLVTSDARIVASLATIRLALDAGASVVVMSHLGRPSEGQYANEYSLAPVARRLSELLECNVTLLAQPEDCEGIDGGEIGLLENVRFLVGEKSNSAELSQRLSDQCDVFVMDAFGTMDSGGATIEHLAPGVSGALLTTVTALCVAIPIVFFYNNLSARTRGEMTKLENFASNLADRIELDTTS